MLNNDTTHSVKLPGTTLNKLKTLKTLYKLKNIGEVVEHLLAENGFEGKEITIKFVPDEVLLRSVMNVDTYRLTENRAAAAALRSAISPPITSKPIFRPRPNSVRRS